MISMYDDRQFMRDMQNIVDYSIGFLDGVKEGHKKFLDNIGASTIQTLKEYVDTMARVDQDLLHHVYEWNKVGSPDARLFDINYIVKGDGLSISSTFKQSSSVKSGSKVPFYDKARIMEQGIPVTIKPKAATVLSFESDGQTIFTKKDIQVSNPGGQGVQGGFEETFNRFFDVYFTQAFLYSSGISEYLKNPIDFKSNLNSGKKGGRSVGKRVGYNWIAKAGVVK
jgi:hypothetical protein